MDEETVNILPSRQMNGSMATTDGFRSPTPGWRIRIPFKPMRYCVRLPLCGMIALQLQENESEVLSWRL